MCLCLCVSVSVCACVCPFFYVSVSCLSVCLCRFSCLSVRTCMSVDVLRTVLPDEKFKVPHRTGTAPNRNRTGELTEQHLDCTTSVPRPHHKRASTAPCLDQTAPNRNCTGELTGTAPRPHHERASTAPQACLDHTVGIPQPRRERTTTVPEEYQRCCLLTFQRAILYVSVCSFLCLSMALFIRSP